MINFVKRGYGATLDAFIDPIIEHLPEYTVSNMPVDGCLNVDFFTEYEASEVFMSHGIADKNWRRYHKVKRFGYICTSGTYWTERYVREGCPREKILEVGYTKLDPIFQGKYKRTPSNKIRVLLAPTHQHPPCVSLEGRLDVKFPEDIELITSLHPSKRGDVPTMQALVDCDFVIADCGSMLYEALALGKPVIFCDWLVKDAVKQWFPHSFEEFIYDQQIGLHARNCDDVVGLVRHGKIGSLTKSFIDGIFNPEYRGCSGKRTAEVLRSLE